MRRAPFQVNPLALSVALLLATPILAFAQNIQTETSTTITSEVSNVGVITINNVDNLTQITGKVLGDAQQPLIKQGTGTLSLTADNGYAGGTSIENGTLAISSDLGLGSTDKTLGNNVGNVAISNGASLQTNANINISKDRTLTITGTSTGAIVNTAGYNSAINGQITGTGKLVKKGGGSLTLGSQTANTYTGGTQIDGGTLIINKNADLGTGVTLEIKDGALQVNQNNIIIEKNITSTSVSGGGINTAGHGVKLNGTVSGIGSLIKSGGGTLTLTKTNTHFDTSVLGGTVSITNNDALGTGAGKLILDGGTLQTTAAMSLAISTKAAPIPVNRDIRIGSGGGTIETVGLNNALEIAGKIEGVGGLTKTGEGVLTLSGVTNAYTGATTVQQGQLVLNSLKGIGSSALVLAGGNVKFLEAVTLSSLTLNGKGGTLDVSAKSSSDQNGPIVTSVTGVMTGTGNFTKTGNGTLQLTADNTYTGSTTISGGNLQITKDTALGTTGSLILDGGTLQTTGTASTITLARGVAITSAGTIDTTTQTNILSGVVSGQGQLIKTGSGILELKGNNTFQGGIKIKEGTLKISTDAALGTGSVEIDGATLAIEGAANNTEIKRNLTLTDADGTLAVTSGTATLSGQIKSADLSTNADLIKSGMGTLNLTANNSTLMGDVIVKEGALGISKNENLAKETLDNGKVVKGRLILDGGNLRINTTVDSNNLVLNKSIVIKSQGGIDTGGIVAGTDQIAQATASGEITGQGLFVKTGDGTLELTAANGYSGGTLIEKGTLAIASITNLGSLGKAITLNGGDLQLLSDINFGGLNAGVIDTGRKLLVGATGGGIDTNGRTITISSVEGAGLFTKKGAGKLSLTANNDSLTGGVTVEQGTLSISEDQQLGSESAVLTLKNNTTSTTTLEVTKEAILNHNVVLAGGNITLDHAAHNVSISQIVSGSGGLIKAGTGVLALNTANTYTGGTTVKAGQVSIGNDAALGTGAVTFASDTILNTLAAVNLTNNVQLSSGNIILMNNDKNSTLNLKGVVSGAGRLVKNGAASLTLSGDNTYTGGTAINAGEVIVSQNTAFGSGVVDFAADTSLVTTADVSMANAVTLAGNIKINSTDKNSTLSGIISGAGNVNKEGSGSLTLSGANTYKGGTNVTAGKVVVSHNTGFGDKNGTVSFAENTSLTIAANVNIENALNLAGNTTVVSLGSGILSGVISGDKGGITSNSTGGYLELRGVNTYKGDTQINDGILAISTIKNLGDSSNSIKLDGGALQTLAAMDINKAILIGTGDGQIDTFAATNNTTVTGVISGAGLLLKSGAGTLTLNGKNTYAGGTEVVQQGVLSISKDENLGDTGGALVLNSGELHTTATDQMTLNRQVELRGADNNVLTIDGDVRIAKEISGNGLVKKGNGNLTLDAVNSYTGGTTISQGSVTINNDSSLGSGDVTFATGTTLHTAKDVAIANKVTLTGNTTVNNANDLVMNGVLGVGSLTKTGVGSLTLTGSNTYAGGLMVVEGKVVVNNATALGSGKATFAANTILETAAPVTLANDIGLAGNVILNSNGQDSTLSGVVSGAGSLIKQDAGSLTLAGVNTYTGGTIINGGKVIIGQSAALGTGTATFSPNTTLEIVSSTTPASLVALGNTLILQGDMAVLNTTESTLSGTITANGRLTKQGSGKLNLTGVNTLSNLSVTAGILSLTNTNTVTGSISILGGQLEDASNGSAKLNLNGGSLQASGNYTRDIEIGTKNGTINTANNANIVGVLSGFGTLSKSGAGRLALSNTNNANYAGNINVDAGVLVIGNQNNIGKGTLSLQNATLEVTEDKTLLGSNIVVANATLDTLGNLVTVSGLVSGGRLTKTGSGTLALTNAANTYNGGTILAAGTLSISSANNLGTGDLTLQKGTLQLKEGFRSTKTLTKVSTDSVTIEGSGAFGKTEVNAGTLAVNGILTSPLTINTGSVLHGSGKVVGDTTVAGTLSAGNSPGILTIDGNLTQASGSTLLVEIDGAATGQYDQVVVTKTFKAGGDLVAKLNAFTPTVGQSFEVVKANSVNGVFASYKKPEAGVAAGTRLELAYTPTTVLLYVTPEKYAAVVSGTNRSNVASILDNQRPENLNATTTTADVAKLYNALIPANAQQIQDALVSMSPAIYAESAQSILAIQQSLHNSQVLSESFKKGGIAVKLLQQDVDVDGDGNGVAATRRVSGLQLALDSEPYSKGLQLGATLSLVNQGDITSQGAALDLTGQDVSLALRKQTKDWLLAAEFDAASYKFDATRHIVLDGSTLTAQSTKATTYGLGINATRSLATNWQLMTGLRYNNVNQNGFSETGNSNFLKLTVGKVQQDQLVAMMGANWQHAWSGANWKVTPKAGLHVEQILTGDTAQIDALLSGQRVSSQASDTGKTLLRAMMGVSVENQDGLTIGVDASGEQGSNVSGTTARLMLSKSF